jgi:uncharacterized protein with HEPN domain
MPLYATWKSSGERSRRCPALKARYPQVEWKSIAGLRDVLIHDYFGVNYREVWAIASEKIEPLKEEIEKILQAEQAS